MSNERIEAQKVQQSGCGCGSSHSLKPRRIQGTSTSNRRSRQKSIRTRFLR
ncbi:hypothetical protein GGQ92_002523 [Gracilibacillus halotolerans]|uniref:Uncharacterized protein n=1 Tax=Gracilibacillus halotolerans TaxID=74386 RepID=A0A841RMI8_9BACI|nr:hypothetical protein [Gracilibacillus halotolerans]MBB6513709.1 hypothetical protein [Gracilibacillus halotolerans]